MCISTSSKVHIAIAGLKTFILPTGRMMKAEEREPKELCGGMGFRERT